MKKRSLPTLLSLALAVGVTTGCAVTPQPITMDERNASLQLDRNSLFGTQEKLQGPISLQEAMARALKYNMDYRVKLMEDALARKQLDLTSLDMLPRLTLGAGYTTRSNDAASSSQDVATGTQSLSPSISSERDRINADLGLSWNVLDFGVSYYAARQQSDRVLITQERKRKVAHQLMQQVREAYWQALAAQQLKPRTDALLKEARLALEDSRKLEQEKLRAPMEALNYQRQLLEVIRQLTAIRRELDQAQPRLASIMNLSPGQPFEVTTPGPLQAPSLGMSLEKMEEAALLNRPELMEARYNERIGRLETRKALAKMLPGVEFSIGSHYDSNSFLINNTWSDAGLRVSWNLLNLFNASTIRGTADAQLKVSESQRMALNMAVLTQVNVGWLNYQSRAAQFALENELNGVEQRILEQTRNATQANAQGKLPLILSGANAVLSELRLYQSYGDLQNAFGQMGATLGLDSLPVYAHGHDLAALTEAFKGAESNWQGTLGAEGAQKQ